jgi:hypothetical protein
MRIDIQAEHILSIQEEKRQNYFVQQARRKITNGHKPSIPAWLLASGGNLLISTGQKLHQLAGTTSQSEVQAGVLREAI